MVIGIFRSRLRAGMDAPGAEYGSTAERMEELARTMPGFRSVKAFAASDGERVTVFEFESLDELDGWREQAEHREAQRRGREAFYASYDLYICDPIREAHFQGEDFRPAE